MTLIEFIDFMNGSGSPGICGPQAERATGCRQLKKTRSVTTQPDILRDLDGEVGKVPAFKYQNIPLISVKRHSGVGLPMGTNTPLRSPAS
jgi:hypothetical protein